MTASDRVPLTDELLDPPDDALAAAHVETKERLTHRIESSERGAYRRAMVVLGLILLVVVGVGGYVMYELSVQAGVNAAQAEADRESAADRAGLRADIAETRAELQDANEARVAEGLEPVPLPTLPPTSDESTLISRVAEAAAVLVLAQIRPAFTADEIAAIVAGQVGQIPIPVDGVDGVDGLPGDPGIPGEIGPVGPQGAPPESFTFPGTVPGTFITCSRDPASDPAAPTYSCV